MQTSRHPISSRPRVGIPVRLNISSDADPKVAEANDLFDHIVELVREGGGDLDPRPYGEEPGDA